VLNQFPTLAVGPDVYADPFSVVTLTATAGDPDPDDVPNLRIAMGRTAADSSRWLLGAMLGQVFSNPTQGSTSFRAPALARVATVPYQTSVADRRGGSAAAVNYVTTSASLAPGGAPIGSLTVTNTAPAVGDTITLVFPAADPEQHPILWAYSAYTLGGGTSLCCLGGVSTNLQFTAPGVFRLKAQSIDTELNVSDGGSVIVRVGGTTGEPPLAIAQLDKLSGPVPLTVNVDMSASTSAAGPLLYGYLCDVGFAVDVASPQGSCTITTPGPHWLEFIVMDAAQQTDIAWAYVVATPADSVVDTTPPTLALVAPAEGASVTGTSALSASASDASGIARVEFRIDTPTGKLLGTSLAPPFSGAPYSVSWDTTATAGGAHKIYAVARDGAGNTASSVRNVTVIDSTPPVVSLTSPAAGKVFATAALTASASDVSGIAKVEYRLDAPAGALLGTSTLAPSYGVSWDTTATAPGSHAIYAVATDGAGNVGASPAVAVNVIDLAKDVPPTVAITFPNKRNSGFRTNFGVEGTAADADGQVVKVEINVDNGPWQLAQNTDAWTATVVITGLTRGKHVLNARATDDVGKVGLDSFTFQVK